MSGDRRTSHVRDRMLGAFLRTARVQVAGLSLEHAAEMAEVSPATMSRTETGKRNISIEEVAILLALYRVPRRQREHLIDAARTGSLAVWWQASASGSGQDAFLAVHEERAAVITDWSMLTVPALLQTRAYAFGVLAAGGVPTRKSEGVWKIRQIRQKTLRSVDYTAYVHEHALRTPFGGLAACAEQVRHLLAVADRGWGVRVVRAGAEVGSLAHSWTLFQFRKESPLVHVPMHRGSGIYLSENEADAFVGETRRLREVACSVRETRDYLTRVLLTLEFS